MLYGSFRRALHKLMRQNHIEPGSNVSDANINYVNVI